MAVRTRFFCCLMFGIRKGPTYGRPERYQRPRRNLVFAEPPYGLGLRPTSRARFRSQPQPKTFGVRSRGSSGFHQRCFRPCERRPAPVVRHPEERSGFRFICHAAKVPHGAGVDSCREPAGGADPEVAGQGLGTRLRADPHLSLSPDFRAGQPGRNPAGRSVTGHQGVPGKGSPARRVVRLLTGRACVKVGATFLELQPSATAARKTSSAANSAAMSQRTRTCRAGPERAGEAVSPRFRERYSVTAPRLLDPLVRDCTMAAMLKRLSRVPTGGWMLVFAVLFAFAALGWTDATGDWSFSSRWVEAGPARPRVCTAVAARLGHRSTGRWSDGRSSHRSSGRSAWRRHSSFWR